MLLTAIAGDRTTAPRGATFDDGSRCAEACDAIIRSGENECRTIEYRSRT